MTSSTCTTSMTTTTLSCTGPDSLSVTSRRRTCYGWSHARGRLYATSRYASPWPQVYTSNWLVSGAIIAVRFYCFLRMLLTFDRSRFDRVRTDIAYGNLLRPTAPRSLSDLWVAADSWSLCVIVSGHFSTAVFVVCFLALIVKWLSGSALV